MTRQISWIRAARKDFEKFPQNVQERMIEVLDLVSEGNDASNTKPMSKIAIVRGNNNIWRDFRYADADVRKAKTVLAAKIITELKRRNLSDRAAAKHIEGIDHSDISRIRNAELKRFTVDRLIRILSQMNCRVDVSVKATRKRPIAKSRTAIA